MSKGFRGNGRAEYTIEEKPGEAGLQLQLILVAKPGGWV